MTKKPSRALSAIKPAKAAPITPQEVQFLARCRTLDAEATRVVMCVFDAVHEQCLKEARPVLRLIQGGRA